MIYLDCAATSLQKPQAVGHYMQAALHTCAGYARSGHAPALRAGETVFQCRESAAHLFDVEDPSRIVFTMNATHALNLAIHALCRPGLLTAVTGYEHNSVMRPLFARRQPIIILRSLLFDPADLLIRAEQAIDAGAKLFVVNHVSNVFGSIVPLQALDDLLARRGIPMILDASQSAGAIPISVRSLSSVAAVCMPGHKGLLGPQGTGILIVCTDRLGEALIQGGTGSLSAELEQPQLLPDRFESGTPNVPGIAGLCAGLSFLQYVGVDQVGAHEQALAQTLIEGLRSINSLTVFHADDPACQSGVISVRSGKLGAEALAARLSEARVCTRAGLHCAPTAHETAGTLDTGTVRLSISWFNTREEILDTVSIFQKIMTNL